MNSKHKQPHPRSFQQRRHVRLSRQSVGGAVASNHDGRRENQPIRCNLLPHLTLSSYVGPLDTAEQKEKSYERRRIRNQAAADHEMIGSTTSRDAISLMERVDVGSSVHAREFSSFKSIQITFYGDCHTSPTVYASLCDLSSSDYRAMNDAFEVSFHSLVHYEVCLRQAPTPLTFSGKAKKDLRSTAWMSSVLSLMTVCRSLIVQWSEWTGKIS